MTDTAITHANKFVSDQPKFSLSKTGMDVSLETDKPQEWVPIQMKLKWNSQE